VTRLKTVFMLNDAHHEHGTEATIFMLNDAHHEYGMASEKEKKGEEED
jgi:hypothetical protein